MSKNKENTLKMPPMTFNVKLEGQDVTIKFPNTGQLIDFQNTIGRYNQGTDYISSASLFGVDVYYLIHAIAFLEVVIGANKKIYNKPIFDLEVHEILNYLNVYRSKIDPWLAQWSEFLKQPIPQIKDDSNDD